MVVNTPHTHAVRRGFTLVELIIALVLLSTIGLLGVLGARALIDDTKDQLGTAAVQAVLSLEQKHMTRTQAFTDDVSALGELEDITITNGPSNSPQTVSVAVDSQGNLVLAAQSKEGCYMLAVPNPLISSGVTELNPGTNSLCDADDGLSLAGS